ncbi:MAG: zinc ribbon domain-containing protein [Promethearchaeota archaeon]|nr:MAG: zinc ribbon domain-containing protein [Candidatus Lokiarchaeota archaeon]
MKIPYSQDIAAFNLEGFYLSSKGGFRMLEFIPTKVRFDELSTQEDYLGVCFVVDNIEKKIWVYQDDTIKTKKIVKPIKNEKKQKKLQSKTETLFEKLMEYDISDFEVLNGLENLGQFTQLFKYQINEFPLYSQHYYLPQYEHEEEAKAAEEEAQEEVTANLKKCPNCGWLISADTEICPKCKRNIENKEE